MGLAGIDDAFELGVRQQAVGDEVRRQMRPVGWLGRRDRGHRRRLHELGGMRLRAGNTDRLQSVFFIKRIREAHALRAASSRWSRRRAPPRPVRGAPERRTDALRRRAPCAGWPGAHAVTAMDASIGKRGGTCSITQASKVAASGATPGECREHARIVGGLLVDDEQPRVDGGAVLRIDRAVDRGGEHEPAALLQASEGVGPSWIVGREARSGDRDETPAFAQPRQGRGDMAKRRVRHAPIDIRHRRERRVHQNHARRDARRRDDRRSAPRRSG